MKPKVKAGVDGKRMGIEGEAVELPRYSSSSLGKMSDVQLVEVVVPKKVHKHGWKKWRNADL